MEVADTPAALASSSTMYGWCRSRHVLRGAKDSLEVSSEPLELVEASDAIDSSARLSSAATRPAIGKS